MARAFLTSAMWIALAVAVLAQEPEGRKPPPDGQGRPGFGGPGFGPGGPGGLMRLPIIAALDADQDGEISAKEIENAAAALKGLDKDRDGKLSLEELRPPMPDGPRGAFGGGFGGFGPPPEERVARLLELDADKDGKLSKTELTERMQGLLTRADTDKDGFATKEELLKLVQSEMAAAREGGGRGEFGPGRPGEGRGPGREGGDFGGGGFRPPSPEAFVERAMQFDTDKDGKLSKEELGKMGDQFMRMFGGPGGPGARGRGPEGDRKERPKRPESDK
jgi:Ca2+-binding EF-hand superfamily protein